MIDDRRGNFSWFEIEATSRVLRSLVSVIRLGDIPQRATCLQFRFRELNNELLISHPVQRECFQECFQGIQALEKFQSPATRRVGVSEIGCNTKPLQTVRARTPVPSASFASPLRRQEFLISFKGYYTLCLLSGNTRDSLSLYLFLTRTSRRKSEKEFLSILSFFFLCFLRASRHDSFVSKRKF